MRISILIISKNRKEALSFTLNKLMDSINSPIDEVLVLLDGCTDDSKDLVEQFDHVKWTVLTKSIGASRARHKLYKEAKGSILIGFDDDAHPLQDNFISIIDDLFQKDKTLGVIAFQEIKGVFPDDKIALAQTRNILKEYLCNNFVGCGFAIKKDVYLATNGFPLWIDIYGEESCVAIEVIQNNKNILYTNSISVNHRIDRENRLASGANYFRFKKQLKNTAFYYMVYYKNPSFKIVKLIFGSFIKYGVRDITFFKCFLSAVASIIINAPETLRHRSPVSRSVIKRTESLARPGFY
jgi:GT2 family glycosyltransferase